AKIARREQYIAKGRRQIATSYFDTAVACYNLSRKTEAQQYAEKVADDEQFAARAKEILSRLRGSRLTGSAHPSTGSGRALMVSLSNAHRELVERRGLRDLGGKRGHCATLRGCPRSQIRSGATSPSLPTSITARRRSSTPCCIRA